MLLYLVPVLLPAAYRQSRGTATAVHRIEGPPSCWRPRFSFADAVLTETFRRIVNFEYRNKNVLLVPLLWLSIYAPFGL